MKDLRLASLGLIFSASAAAQTHLSTPPNIDSREGSDAALIFGWAANQKHRFMDASHLGKVRGIKQVAFRPDYRNHKAIPRTWQRVRLLAGHADYSSVQYNKSTAFKQIGSSTTVFDRRWSFPALQGFPLLKPADWGGPQGALAFRFGSPFAYSGSDALFLEFQFSGGTADTGQPWVGATPVGFEYYLDSMSQAEWRGGIKTTLPATPAPCFDSRFLGKKLPFVLSATLSGLTSAQLRIESRYSAPTAPLVYGLGLKVSAAGVDLGAACNRLHLQGNFALLAVPAPNNSLGSASLGLQAPRQAWMDGIFVQAAWSDPLARQLRLSEAVQVSAGGEIPLVVSYEVGGFQVWTAAPKGTPFIRYSL